MNKDRQLLGPLSVSILKELAAGSSAQACSPRFVVVSDLPEWTVWDQERQCDLFPTKSGNRDYSCCRCGEDTAHLIADALNAYMVNESGQPRLAGKETSHASEQRR